MEQAWTLESAVQGVNRMYKAGGMTLEEAQKRLLALIDLDNWALQMGALLGYEHMRSIERWAEGKSENELEAARQHAMFTGEFPPPE